MPAPDTECFQIFLNTVAKRYSKDLILIVADGAGNHFSEELEVPANIILQPLPPYSPELNPQENIWDEIREKIFKNYALKSMEEVNDKLEVSELIFGAGSFSGLYNHLERDWPLLSIRRALELGNLYYFYHHNDYFTNYFYIGFYISLRI